MPGLKIDAVADFEGPSGALSPAHGPGLDAVVDDSHPRQQDPRSPSQAPKSNSQSPHSSPQPSLRQHQSTPSHYAEDQPSTTNSSSDGDGGSNYTTTPAMPDHFEMSTAKRRKVSVAGATRRASQATTIVTQSPKHQGAMAEVSSPLLRGSGTPKGQSLAQSRRGSESLEPGTSAPSPILSKPRRVRTGCLTCRNRHLKCDEAMPICLNCQKSNRKCERGVRLNFIDLKVEQPPYLLPPVDWKGMWNRIFPWSHVVGLQRVGLTCHFASAPN